MSKRNKRKSIAPTVANPMSVALQNAGRKGTPLKLAPAKRSR
jgi:hypothetical protein